MKIICANSVTLGRELLSPLGEVAWMDEGVHHRPRCARRRRPGHPLENPGRRGPGGGLAPPLRRHLHRRHRPRGPGQPLAARGIRFLRRRMQRQRRVRVPPSPRCWSWPTGRASRWKA
ncbi:MAG: hypothetical protein U1F87_18890 [Kiritimatiellia bacterium]